MKEYSNYVIFIIMKIRNILAFKKKRTENVLFFLSHKQNEIYNPMGSDAKC